MLEDKVVDIRHTQKIIALAWKCQEIAKRHAEVGAWTDYDVGSARAAESILEEIEAIDLDEYL